MKQNYNNLNEQLNRMKSMMTEERLYGNLIEAPTKRLIVEGKGDWLDALVKNIKLGKSYFLNGAEVMFVKGPDGEMMIRRMSKAGKWMSPKSFTFADIVGEMALKKAGLFDGKVFKNVDELENYYRVGMKNDIKDSIELLYKNIGMDAGKLEGYAAELAEEFADNVMKSLKQANGGNKIELLMNAPNFWKYTDADGVNQTVKSFEQFEKRLDDVLSKNTGEAGESLKDMLDMVPGMRKTLFNGYEQIGKTKATMQNVAKVVDDGLKVGDTFVKDGKTYMKTKIDGTNPTLIPDKPSTLSASGKPYTQEEYIEMVKKNLDNVGESSAPKLIDDINFSDIFTPPNKIDLAKAFKDSDQLMSAINKVFTKKSSLIWKKFWGQGWRLMPIIGLTRLGHKYPWKYSLHNMKNKKFADLTGGQVKWFDMHYGNKWRVETPEDAVRTGKPKGSINIHATPKSASEITSAQNVWSKRLFGKENYETFKELFSDLTGLNWKNLEKIGKTAGKVFDGLEAWNALRRHSWFLNDVSVGTALVALWAVFHPIAAFIKLGEAMWWAWDEKEEYLKPMIVKGKWVECANDFKKLYMNKDAMSVEMWNTTTDGEGELTGKDDKHFENNRWKEEFGDNMRFLDAATWTQMIHGNEEIEVTTFTIPGQKPMKLWKPYTIKGIKSEIDKCAEMKAKPIWDKIMREGPGDIVFKIIGKEVNTVTGLATWLEDPNNAKLFTDAFMDTHALKIQQAKEKIVDGETTVLEKLKLKDDEEFSSGGVGGN